MNLIKKKAFEDHMSSADFCEDLDASQLPTKLPHLNVSTVTYELTVMEFHHGGKRDKMHYEDLKDDKLFNTWNCGLLQLLKCTIPTWFWMKHVFSRIYLKQPYSRKYKHLCIQYWNIT
jgi:hypothetical protein